MHIINNKSKSIGIISDTHGILRPSIKSIFKDCNTIVHAGDIGNQKILDQLENIAPLVVVRGNTDLDSCFSNLPENKIISLYGISFYIIHDINKLDIDLISAGIEVVVSGHTHKPKIFEQSGVKYINPGSAGHYRIGCPITLGLISFENKMINMKIIRLD